VRNSPIGHFMPRVDAPATTLIHDDVIANDVTREFRVDSVLTAVVGGGTGGAAVVVVDEVTVNNVITATGRSGINGDDTLTRSVALTCRIMNLVADDPVRACSTRVETATRIRQ